MEPGRDKIMLFCAERKTAKGGARIARLAMAGLFALGCVSAGAQGPPEPAHPMRPVLDGVFKIGYLAHGSDLETPGGSRMRDLMEALREVLVTSPRVAGALRSASFEDVQIRSCEDPFDMLQRLRAGEFDMAFATSVLFARLLAPEPGAPKAPERINYTPILQSRHAGDLPQPGQAGFFRRAAIIIGPGSSLWGKRGVKLEEIMPELERGGLAVGDYYSAANCVWPLIRLHAIFPDKAAPDLVFCRSSSEVFKHVASGLVAAGACELRLLGEDGRQSRLAREVMRSEPFPTDPILMRVELMPGAFNLNVGPEVRSAVQNFFNAATPPPAPGIMLEPAESAPYEQMNAALSKFDEAIAGR